MSDDESWLSDDEEGAAEWREYHERCCRDGDGWSHGFLVDRHDCEGEGGALGLCGVKPGHHDVICQFTLQNWRRMGDSMSRIIGSRLRFVDLSCCGITGECIAALFPPPDHRHHHHHNHNHHHGQHQHGLLDGLEKLELSDNSLGEAGASALLPLLTSQTRMVYLGLSRTALGDGGARALSRALDRGAIVPYLNLRDNSIGDEGLEILLSAANSSRIVELIFIENDNVGRRGYEAISRFLGRDDTALRKLSANCPNGRYAKMIIDSISNGSALEDIYLWSGGTGGGGENEDGDRDDDGNGNGAMKMALPNVQNLVCNTSTLEAMISSNHQMKWLGIYTDAILESNPTVRRALDINARSRFGASTTRIVRCKLREFYFRRREDDMSSGSSSSFDLCPFANMDVSLMPHVLALVTREEACEGKICGFLGFGSGTYTEGRSTNLGGVYRILRNCHLPELYCFVSRGETAAAAAATTTTTATTAAHHLHQLEERTKEQDVKRSSGNTSLGRGNRKNEALSEEVALEKELWYKSLASQKKRPRVDKK